MSAVVGPGPAAEAAAHAPHAHRAGFSLLRIGVGQRLLLVLPPLALLWLLIVLVRA